MALQFVRAIFGSAADEAVSKARTLARCDCSQPSPDGGLLFRVYQLDGQNHFHIECRLCQVSYCPRGGQCYDG